MRPPIRIRNVKVTQMPEPRPPLRRAGYVGTLIKRSIFLWFALVSQPVPAVAGWLARRTDGQGKLDVDIGHRRGDPSRDFKFWVYPVKQRLVNRQWDTHEHPRNYCIKYRVNQRLENVCRVSHRMCAGLSHCKP